MENTRRSFLKKMTAAGIGTAGLALSSNAAATVTTETSAEKKKKPVRWIISPSSMFRLRRYIQAANVNLKRC